MSVETTVLSPPPARIPASQLLEDAPAGITDLPNRVEKIAGSVQDKVNGE